MNYDHNSDGKLTLRKVSLKTRWNWTDYSTADRRCYGIIADTRAYRVLEEIDRITKKSHFRIDLLGSLGMIWEALDSVRYRTPTGAARAVVKHHAQFVKQERSHAA